MRILQVTPCFYPAWAYGGPPRNTYEIVKELAKRGHEVTVYTTDTIDKNCRQKEKVLDVNGVKVYYFRNISNSLAWKRFFFAPGMIFKLKREIKTFDIIHLQDFRNFQNIAVHYYAKKYGIPYIVQARGSVETFFQKGRLKRVFDIFWGYRILKDASRLIALTTMEAQQYKNMGIAESKIEIVPNGINLSEFENLPQKGEFRRKHGLNDDQKIILYLGRIYKQKGLDLLGKAFADLSKEIDNVRLVIAGPDDGYLSTLRKLINVLGIEDKVLYTGPLYQRDKLEAYVDADIYVLPSTYEIFGVTVLEALACGTPVIVTERCGVAYWINEAVCVIQYDEEQLRGALAKVLVNEEYTRQFKNKRRLLIRNFTWSKLVERLDNIYQGLETSHSEGVPKPMQTILRPIYRKGAKKQ